MGLQVRQFLLEFRNRLFKFELVFHARFRVCKGRQAASGPGKYQLKSNRLRAAG